VHTGAGEWDVIWHHRVPFPTRGEDVAGRTPAVEGVRCALGQTPPSPLSAKEGFGTRP